MASWGYFSGQTALCPEAYGPAEYIGGSDGDPTLLQNLDGALNLGLVQGLPIPN